MWSLQPVLLQVVIVLLLSLELPTIKDVLQSGASSRAKHGGAYFSAVRGSMKHPIAVPGRDEVQEC